MTVGMGHEFIALFRSRVEADGVVHVVAGPEGHGFVQAVDGGAGGKDQVFDVSMTVAFEDVEGSRDVRVNIGMGVEQAVPDVGLGSEVDDAVEFFLLEESGYGFAVGDVEPDEGVVFVFGALYGFRPFHFGGIDAAFFEPAVFQVDVVIVVDVVNADYFVPSFEKPKGRVDTDEAGCSGDENFHELFLLVIILQLRYSPLFVPRGDENKEIGPAVLRY